METAIEVKQIKQLAREIAREKLAPLAATLDRDLAYPREGLRLLAEAGLMGITVPAAWGGAGADTVSFIEAVQEIARACANTALVFVTHLTACAGILVGGKEPIKKELLPSLSKGEKIAAFAATESGCGANVLALQTAAQKAGDGSYRVAGSKVFVTSGNEADVYLIAVRTGPGPAGLSLLLVEQGTPGLTFGRKDVRLGMNGVSSCEMSLNDCPVPAPQSAGSGRGLHGRGYAYGRDSASRHSGDSGRAGPGGAGRIDRARQVPEGKRTVDRRLSRDTVPRQRDEHSAGSGPLTAARGSPGQGPRTERLTRFAIPGQVLRDRDGHRRD
jgi:alkylation response protein AidB-like acyl-CoA dehydrogenase